MEIMVELTGHLAHSPQGELLRSGRIVLPNQAVLEDALQHIGVPAKNPYIVTVDGKLARRSQPLKDGCIICLIPPISGG
jgi:molybdopterin converting factor small subunit